MKPAVALPAADLSVFLRSSLERTLSAQNEVQLAATVHLLGSTVNKRAPGKELYFHVLPLLVSGAHDYSNADLADFLESDVESLYRSTIASVSVPAAQRRSALRAYSWVCSESRIFLRCDDSKLKHGFGGLCRSQRASLFGQISVAMP